MKLKKDILVSLLLRTGLAISFFYAAISSLISPVSWAGYVPEFLTSFINMKLYLPIHSVYDFIIGFFLIIDYKTFYTSILAALTIFLIIIFNLPALDIVFRDIGLLLMAIALVVLYYKKPSSKK